MSSNTTPVRELPPLIGYFLPKEENEANKLTGTGSLELPDSDCPTGPLMCVTAKVNCHVRSMGGLTSTALLLLNTHSTLEAFMTHKTGLLASLGTLSGRMTLGSVEAVMVCLEMEKMRGNNGLGEGGISVGKMTENPFSFLQYV